MPCNEKGITIVLSMFDLAKLGFGVRMDANSENEIFAKKGGKVRLVDGCFQIPIL